MSSRVPSKPPLARSLYVAVFLAMLTTLSLSFVIFRQISLELERRRFDPVYDRLDELQLESAIRIREGKGAEELRNYLTHLDQVSGAHHYLLDAQGVDVLSGDNRAALLPPQPALKWRVRVEGHSLAAQRSPDGRYWFAAVGAKSWSWIWAFVPYYLLVAGATASLCWLASLAVISPVRRIAASITRFGTGDLTARVHSGRRDEIGQLARSFDQMAEQLQRKITTERNLLADVSHELRSPLARLKFAVRLARTSHDSEAALDRIDRDVDRLSALVAGIVDVASAEGDFDNPQVETVHLGELLDEVLHDCAIEAEMRGCEIKLHERPDAAITGVRELLRRAIENVVRNGIRYSPEHGVVDIASTSDAVSIALTIRDHGPGVPDEELSRIFDPFFRGEGAGGTAGGGSGLGLSIAKRALLVHGGTISADNAQPGLRVRMDIPRRAASDGKP